jgi:hypothetical protein
VTAAAIILPVHAMLFCAWAALFKWNVFIFSMLYCGSGILLSLALTHFLGNQPCEWVMSICYWIN